MKVICINDKNLPSGANIVKGDEYEVIDIFTNAAQEKAYLLKNAPNEGVTKMGFPWFGYKASRFKPVEKEEQVKHKVEYLMN